MKPLNPIMAALVIASVGASPLRTLANVGDIPASAVTTTDDKNPVNALAKILSETPAARVDAGKRAEAFLLEADSSGNSFVASGVDKVALGALAREWGTTTAGAGTVAMFYFVAGPGSAAPAWAQKDPILSKAFVPGMKWELRLREALKVWTDKTKSQITPAQEKTQATAFLNHAAAQAATVFADPRTKAEIDLSVKTNDTTATVVPDTRGAGRNVPFDGSMSQYSTKDLYMDGAVVVNVAGNGDANSRTISMKIYTKRMPDGSMRNEIGIFDITDAPDNIYGQRFPANGADQTFALDDRTPGHKKYELKFTKGENGERKVTFGRPGGGSDLVTSVEDLFLKRADQAAALGNIVNVGGEDFYVLPQGGAKGALAMFSKSMIDGRAQDNARNIIPALFSNVMQRNEDGRNENIPAGDKGGPHLGRVGTKDYHLVFNAELGRWEITEGAGDLPKAPAPPASTTTPGTGTTTPGTDPGTDPATDPGTTTPPAGSGAEDVINLLLAEVPGKCKREDYSKLRADLKGKYGLVACTDARTGVEEVLVVPIAPETTGGQIRYGSVPGYQLKKARLVDHYIVLTFDKQVQYLDFLKKDAEGRFIMNGQIDLPGKGAQKFSDVDLYVDAMINTMGIAQSDESVTEVPKRVKASMGSKPYYISSGFSLGKLVVSVVTGGTERSVWPIWEKEGEQPATPVNQYASVGGATNAMDSLGTVSSAEQKFPAVLELPESRRAVPMAGHGATTDSAVYESVDSPKKYFLEIKYYAMDPKDPAKPDGERVKKVFHHKFFEVFGGEANPLPASFTAQGLLTAGAVVNRSTAANFRFIKGTGKEKGVLAMFQNKQVSDDNQREKAANCVGPVIWWGLADRDAAQKACLDDKL